MKRFVTLLSAAALLAGCASETRVVNDHSVASQFASFTKAGWQVSGSEPGGGDPRTRQKPVPLNPEQSNAAFGNLKVITSFPGSPGEAQEQRAAAAAAATRPASQPPAGVLPLLTGQ